MSEITDFLDGVDAEPQLERPIGINEFLGPDKRPGVVGAVVESAKNTGRAIASTINTYQGDAQPVVEAAKAQAEAPRNADSEAFLKAYDDKVLARGGENAGLVDSIAAGLGAVVEQPKGAGVALLELLPNAAPNLAGGYAGMKSGAEIGAAIGSFVPNPAGRAAGAAIGGAVGGIAGTFAGYTMTETGYKAMEAARDGAYTPEEQAQVTKDGAVKSGVLALVDTATLGLGRFATRAFSRAAERALDAATTKVLKEAGVDVTDAAAVAAAKQNPALVASVQQAQRNAAAVTNRFGKRAAEAGTLLTMETVGEGVGEYLGELAATGEGSVSDAVLESLLSAGQSGIEAAWNIKEGRKQPAIWEDVPAAAGPQAPSAPTPEPQPMLALPAPDVLFTGPDGQPTREVPEGYQGQAWVNPENSLYRGGPGMDQPARPMVQPLPTPENPAPAPVERPDPSNGVLSAAAARLPSIDAGIIPQQSADLMAGGPINAFAEAGAARAEWDQFSREQEADKLQRAREESLSARGAMGERAASMPAIPEMFGAEPAASPVAPAAAADAIPQQAEDLLASGPLNAFAEAGAARQEWDSFNAEREGERVRLARDASAEEMGAMADRAAALQSIPESFGGVEQVPAAEVRALSTTFKSKAAATRAKSTLPAPDTFEVQSAGGGWALRRIAPVEQAAAPQAADEQAASVDQAGAPAIAGRPAASAGGALAAAVTSKQPAVATLEEQLAASTGNAQMPQGGAVAGADAGIAGGAQAPGAAEQPTVGQTPVPIITKKGGKPFPSKEALKKSLPWQRMSPEERKGFKIAQVDGGFVAKPKAPRAPVVQSNEIDPSRDDLLAAIAKAGGVSREEAQAKGIDPAEFGRRGHKIARVFTKGGRSFDAMAENLSQMGYFPPGEAYTANGLLAMLDRGLRGERVMTPAGLEAEAERQAEERERMLALRDGDLEALEALAPDMESDEAARLAADERMLGELVLRAARELAPRELEALGDFIDEYKSAADAAAALDLALRGDNEQSRKLAALGQARDARRREGADSAPEQRQAADGADEWGDLTGQRIDITEDFTDEEIDRVFSGEPVESILADRERAEPVLEGYTEADLAEKEKREQQQETAAEKDKRAADALVDGFNLSAGGGTVAGGRSYAGPKPAGGLFDKPAEREQPKAEKPQSAQAPDQEAAATQVAPSADRPEKKPGSFGANNKLVSLDRADVLRERLRKKLIGNQLNSGFDPELLAIGAELAAFHIEAGARKFAEFAKSIAADIGSPVEALRPYLRAWYNGARDLMEDGGIDVGGMDSPESVREQMKMLGVAMPADGGTRADGAGDTLKSNTQEDAADEPGADGGMEQDRPGARSGDQVGKGSVPDAAGGNGRSAGGAARKNGKGRVQQHSDSSVSDDGAIAGGEAGDSGIRGEQPGAGASAAGRADGGRGAELRDQRLDDGREGRNGTAGAVEPARSNDAELEQKRAAQREAASRPIKLGDLESVRASLPFLLDLQQEDVHKVEQRFLSPEGYGMLLTNGTGTGKTYSGAGTIARFVYQGRDDVLVIAPSAVQREWLTALENLGVTAKLLSGIKDNGSSGVVVTTHENAGQNDSLVHRKWDLVVVDESHKLLENLQGEPTLALKTLRAVTMHPRGDATRARQLRADDYASLKELSGQINGNLRIINSPDTMDDHLQSLQAENAKLESRRQRLAAELRAHEERVTREVQAAQGIGRTRTLFLSATPFASHFALDYAEGYLFSYGPEKEGVRAYNEPNARDSFFVSNFGYRMRYNKLTRPDAEVNSAVMEVEFNERLKRDGSISGRALVSDRDYSRDFILIDDAVGAKIDEGIEWLREQAKASPAYSALYQQLEKQFDYLTRMRLLEAIKARHAVPIIQKHLAMGRKVYVMHDYIDGGGFHPFRFALGGSVEVAGKQIDLADVVRDFNKARPDLVSLDLSGLASPLEVLSGALGNELLQYNGRQSRKYLEEAKREFSRDGGDKNVMLIQRQKGKAGISLHDTTGKHQRVMIDLGIPGRATDAIQGEGRGYRVGVQTDLPILYMTTATNFENFAFARKTAERSGTAENLGMGSLARGLRDAILDAYQSPIEGYEPHEGEGKGGKERDRALAVANAVTPFERAKSFYFGQQKNAKRRNQRESAEYYATPEPVGFKMVEWANLNPGEQVLEPSAGHGAIARFFPESAKRVLIEPSMSLASRAGLSAPGAEVLNDSFESHHIVNKYDAIVMNPPYGMGGKLAADHVAKAITHLRDGGRLVALIPEGPTADKRFERLLGEAPGIYQVGSVSLPRVTFERAGTQVKTRILVLEKQETDDGKAKLLPSRDIDLSSTDGIGELFERLEQIEMRERVRPPQAEQAQPVNEWRSSAALPPGEVPGFDLKQTKHAKHGYDLFVAAPSARVSKDDYQRTVEVAKRHGGWYSAFRGNGAIPGYQFKSEEARNSFIAEVSPGSQSPALSIADASPSAGMASGDLRAAIQAAMPKHAAIIDVAQTLREAASMAGQDAEKIMSAAGTVEGFYLPGTGRIVLVADAMSGKRRALFVAAHEVLHRGLDKAYGLQLRGQLRQADKNRFVSALADALARNRTTSGRMEAVEEALVELGAAIETGDFGQIEERYGVTVPNGMRPGVKSVAQRFMNWARGVYQKLTGQQFSDADVLAMLRKAREASERPATEREFLDVPAVASITNDGGGIRFSVAPAARERAALEKIGLSRKQSKTLAQKLSDLKAKDWNTVLRDIGRRANEGIFDGLAGMLYAERALGIDKKSAKDRGYVLARMATGIADIMHAVLHYGAPEWKDGWLQHRAGTKGMLEVLGELGEDVNDWLAWMGAHRGEELMASGRERNLTAEDIKELKDRAKGKEAKFERVRQEYLKINRAMLDLAEGAGLINPEERKLWESEWYVPFYRIDDESDMVRGPFTKRGLSHQSAGIKALKGGESATNDLLENILTNWMKLVDASVKNRAALQAVDNFKGTRFLRNETLRFTQAIVPRSEIAKQVLASDDARIALASMMGLPEEASAYDLIADLGKPENSGIEKMWSLTAPRDPDIIMVRRNGKAEYHRVTDAALLRAFAPLTVPHQSDILRNAGRAMKRLLTTGITASPDFMLRNYIRDAVHAWMINPDGMRFAVDSLRGMKAAAKEDADYWAMAMAGASLQGGYVHATDPEAAAQQIRRALELKGYRGKDIAAYENSVIRTGAQLVDAIRMGWQKYRGWGDKVENANRLANYKAGLAAGKTPLQSAFESKDLMDYSLLGNFAAMQLAVDLIPFLNARLQGLSKLARASVQEDAKLSDPRTWLRQEVAIKGAYVALFTLGLAALNGDDERYKELPDWDKDANWHFWLGDQHWRIPKPFELGIVFGTIPERLFHSATGNQQGDDLRRAMGHAIFDTLSFNPIPQAVRPVVETWANWDEFRDAPIESMGDERLLPEARYNERTSETARAVGALLGYSPKQIEHLIRGYTGTIGAYVLGMTDFVVGSAAGYPSGPDAALSDYPVISVLYRGDGPAKSTQYHTDFYNALKEAREVYATVRDYQRDGRGADAQELAQENMDALRSRARLENASESLSSVRKQIGAVMRDASLSGAEKRARIEALRERSNLIAQRAVGE